MTTAGEHVINTKDHSHAPDVRNSHVRTVLHNIREQAATTNDPPRRLIRENTKNIESRVSAVELPSNQAITRSVRRIRRQIGGPFIQPNSLAELELVDEFSVTIQNESFVLLDNKDDTDRIIIFTTTANLRFLVYCPEWHMDGTFDVTPPLFKQLYTIHGKF